MVQALITLNEEEDRVLNIVKGKFGLKNKSEAVSLIIDKFEEEILEPGLRPEYLDRLAKIENEKGVPFRNISELRKIIKG
jgi:hypothetical protein